MAGSTATFLYHLTTAEAWAEAERSGALKPDSLAREGFVHLSTEAQWRRTVARFFAGAPGLLLLRLRPDALGAEVRFEPADGELFPHLYGPLPAAAVAAVTPLAFDAGGTLVEP